ncbi:hypothetical protein K1W54_42905, partial [Micromonospora sp. CPCC 205371]|nr:hypothetical protein [Micromonospora sp. CPCC 205371]
MKIRPFDDSRRRGGIRRRCAVRSGTRSCGLGDVRGAPDGATRAPGSSGRGTAGTAGTAGRAGTGGGSV